MPAIYITGIAISGLFILFIIAKKRPRRSDYLLIVINLLLCGFLLLDWLVKEQITVPRFFPQKRFTILALGLESGFNSKASLNRVFKEETGLSPREYQLRHLSE